jgi:hypothetical protein
MFKVTVKTQQHCINIYTMLLLLLVFKHNGMSAFKISCKYL